MRITLFVLALFLVAPVLAQSTEAETKPATTHTAITPSNTASLLDNNGVPLCRALFIESGGDISITDLNDTTIVYTVPDATLLPFRPKRVNSTSTTATGISCWAG